MAKSKLTRGERQKIVQFLYRFELFDSRPTAVKFLKAAHWMPKLSKR